MPMLNMLNVYADPTVDPGPVHTSTLNATTAKRHLVAAVTSGDLSALPVPVQRALELHDQLEHKRGALSLTQAPPDLDVAARALAHEVITQGKSVPEASALADLALEVQGEQARHGATVAALNALERQARSQVTATLLAEQDGMLAEIRDRVGEVLTSARSAVEQIGGIDLNDSAQIAAGTKTQREAVSALPVLARTYNRLRMVQRDVYAVTGQEPPGTTAWNSGTAQATWNAVFSSGVHEFSSITLGSAGTSVELPSITRLLAVARRTDVWVPTYEQMGQALTQMRAPVRPETSTKAPEVTDGDGHDEDERAASTSAARVSLPA